MNVEDKVAVVTGGASGIGLELMSEIFAAKHVIPQMLAQGGRT